MEILHVNETRYDALMTAISRFTWGKHFEIYTMNELPFGNHEPYVFGVNWSATGTQNAETTRAFAMDLLKASALANALTDMHLRRVWDTEDEFITTKEEYQESITAILEDLEYAWSYSDPREMDYVFSIIKKFMEAGACTK